MNIEEQYRTLEKLIQARYQPVRTEIEIFPSGAVMLDVFYKNRWFVSLYSPTLKRFGVDENLDDDGFDDPYRYSYPDFEGVKNKLLEFLDS